jgi:hypothetical protein
VRFFVTGVTISAAAHWRGWSPTPEIAGYRQPHAQDSVYRETTCDGQQRFIPLANHARGQEVLVVEDVEIVDSH